MPISVAALVLLAGLYPATAQDDAAETAQRDSGAVAEVDALEVADKPAAETDHSDFTESASQELSSNFAGQPKTSGASSPQEITTAESILAGGYEGQVVTLKAEVLDILQGKNEVSLLLEQDGVYFEALAKKSVFGSVLEALKRGSEVSITGTCSLIDDHHHHVSRSFYIQVENANAIQILKEPTWWTVEHTFLVTGALFITLTGVVGWLMMLRSKVREQTELIRTRLEKEAVLQTKYRELFEHSNDIFFRLDRDGKLISLNPTGERITGYSEEEVEELSIVDLATDSGKRKIESIIKNPTSDEHQNAFELTISDKFGQPVVLEMSAYPFFQEDECVGFHGIARDITERRESEKQLVEVNKELVETSRRAGMAEVATGVLHNVGNVLNSINVSTSVISEKVNKSRSSNLVKVVNLINENAKVPNFLTEDPKGKQVPGYLTVLVDYLAKERAEISTELELLNKNIQHVKDIVSMQQAYACVSGTQERVLVEQLVEDSIQINIGALTRHEITLVRDFQMDAEVLIDKPKVLQILVNLIRNAKNACDASEQETNELTVSIKKSEFFYVSIEVRDNGDGIAEENLTKIFQHGFTTRKDGNGFGLHSAALAVKELGGLLTAKSDGPGLGATFVLELPETPPSDEP